LFADKGRDCAESGWTAQFDAGVALPKKDRSEKLG